MNVEAIQRFTDLWRSGESPPDVFAFLSEHSQASLPEQLEIVLEDQQRRWPTGRPLTVEDYLGQIPGLANDQEARLALALGEFQARQRRSERPQIAEFTSRFADLEDLLRAKLGGLASNYGDTDIDFSATQSFSPAVEVGRRRDIPEKTPDRVGRYRLIKLLGEGMFGRVWLAVDDELRREVAIKVPAPGRFRELRDADAYLEEARTLATLDHPHIVPVYDVGRTDDGSIYVVSKFIKGRTLADSVENRRLGYYEIAAILAYVAEALHHAHQRKLVHRDVKPANILVEELSNRPYVADFGLAVNDADYLRDGVIVGTPSYMSPEQARGEGNRADGRSDIFSLGVVLYELLTHTKPFEGKSTAELLDRVISADPRHPNEFSSEIPAELIRICFKCLAKRPEQRYQTAAEVTSELRRYCQEGSAKKQFNNLPAQLSTIIGRDAESEEVRALIAKSRMITLTGPGGVGKTRLALHVAERVVSDFPQGIYLVELSTIRDPELLYSAIAAAVKCTPSSNTSLAETLQSYFSNKKMLLILDNFEQLLGAADRISGLLAVCPSLHMLVTSRAPLRVRGEQEYSVPLLDLPPRSRFSDAVALAENPAVALFVQRAREAMPSFQLSSKNAAHIAEICKKMDGLPLAIELAAARVNVLTPQAIAKRLEGGLKLLAAQRADLPERQQTLQAAIAWSHDLLKNDERVLFRRLAVFQGGCTFEAAEGVIGEDSSIDVLEGFSSLVDNSLLRRTLLDDGTIRFGMLETIREFARERLDESGDREQISERHALFFTAMAEEIDPQLRGPESEIASEQLARDHANLQAVLAWCLQPSTDPMKSSEIGSRLGGALWRYLCTRGHCRDSVNWYRRFIAGPGADRTDSLGAKAHYAAGCIFEDLGDFREARRMYEIAKEIWDRLGDQVPVGNSLIALGSVSLSQGAYADAQRHFNEALQIGRSLNDDRLIGVAQSNLGGLAWSLGDYETARRCHEECLGIRRRRSDKSGIAISLTSLGLVAARTNDLPRAKQLYSESLEIMRQMDNPMSIAVCLNNLAEIAGRLKNYREARRYLAEAIKLQHEHGDKLSLTYSLETLGSVVRGEGHFEQSTRYYSVAELIRTVLNAPLPPAEREPRELEFEELRSALGIDQFRAIWDTAQTTPPEQSIDQILGEVG